MPGECAAHHVYDFWGRMNDSLSGLKKTKSKKIQIDLTVRKLSWHSEQFYFYFLLLELDEDNRTLYTIFVPVSDQHKVNRKLK